MNPRFYSESSLALPAGTVLDVSPDVARHIQVLRLQPGDAVTLFDGSGSETPARLLAIGKRSATVELGASVHRDIESPYRITLAQGIAGGDKMDWLLEKAVELGITTCQPLQTEKSLVRLQGERAERRVTHWQALARAACEQCGRNRVPEIASILTWRDWLAGRSVQQNPPTVLLSPRADTRVVDGADTQRDWILQTGLQLVIGPEGGLSPTEESQALAAGCVPLQLGPRVLRTETASLAAIAALHAVLGGF